MQAQHAHYLLAAHIHLSSWARYSLTIWALDLLRLTFNIQFLGGFSQPFFQVISPKYSELWFDVKTRTTATMIIALGKDLYIVYLKELNRVFLVQPIP